MWKTLYEKYGVQPVQHQGVLVEDPFSSLAAQARQYAPTCPSSRVSVSLATASDDYSRQKLSVTITCPCPSSEQHISMTTEAAFLLARRMLNEGAESLNLPLL